MPIPVLLPALAAVSVLTSAPMSSSFQPDARAIPHAKPRLIAEHTTAAPGSTIWLGVSFDLDPEWHIYWDGDGDTGQPVTAVFTLPPGCKVGAIVWPAPKRQILADSILDYVYENRVTLLVPLEVPASAKTGDNLRIAADLKWMECSEECIPRKARVQIDLSVATSGSTKSSDATRFDEARRRVPRSLEESAKVVQSAWSGDTLSLAVPGASRLIFYPHRTSARLADALTQADVKKDRLQLAMDPNPPSGSENRRDRVIGILEVASTKEGKQISEFYSIEATRPGKAARPGSESSTTTNQPSK